VISAWNRLAIAYFGLKVLETVLKVSSWFNTNEISISKE